MGMSARVRVLCQRRIESLCERNLRSPERENHKANLMALCSSCHDAVHDGSSTLEDSDSNYSKPSVMKNISPLTEDSHGNRIRRIKTTKGYRVNIHR